MEFQSRTWCDCFLKNRGCSLSTLIGALFLRDLDEELPALEAVGVSYVRYSDDLLILAPTRWKLRRAIRIVRTAFAKLELEMHPDKTFIGRVERGVDWLGYHITPSEVTVSGASIERFLKKARRLYERNPSDPRRVGEYVQRWVRAYERII